MTYDSAVHPMPCPKEDPGRPFGGNTLIPLKNGYPDFVRLPLVRTTPRRVEAESIGGAVLS
jgi:hypothetical protein